MKNFIKRITNNQNFLGEFYNVIIYIYTLSIFILDKETEESISFAFAVIYLLFFLTINIYSCFSKKEYKSNKPLKEINSFIGVINPAIVAFACCYNSSSITEGYPFVLVGLIPILLLPFCVNKNKEV